MSSKRSTQLNCFSPPVMIATVIIELGLALYAIWRYKLDVVGRLIVLMLIALATFQVAEYFVCTGASGHAVQWSRVGFVAITALPPLGLHLMHVLANKPGRRLVWTVYGIMAVFMVFFLTAHSVFTGHQCTGNYVIFQFSSNVTGIYSLYYYCLLLLGIGLGWRWANELQAAGKKLRNRLNSVRALMIGYLVFILPTGLAMTIKPETSHGIPSIMCGFAVLLALIIALYILPRMGTVRLTK